ncbi:hypothetical protein SJ20_00555 [Micrococcus sp. MS-ASIII-49]|uniref:AAA family ATPase n=1 Tax=Micrococcus sp. MS-ASIII-49 TaxID=1593237 RepID=UPI0010155D61|nr:AAA family ATPase [Micrococcus sp. MS-ASIII-49]RYD01088.1 hypothetical protein SJ20_00555 [Micrococcus sp. MS-ASIII-49]
MSSPSYVLREGAPEEFLQWLDLDNPVRAVEKKPGTPTYVLAELTHPGRDAQVLARYGAALDADAWTPEAASALFEVVAGLGLWAVIHTTHSTTEETVSCRVILLYSRPVTPEEHLRITRALMEELAGDGHAFDSTCVEPKRDMFRPVVHPDRAELYRSQAVPGDLLDVEEWLSRAPTEAATASVVEAVEAVQDPDRADRVVELILSKDLPELAALPEGGRTDDGHGWYSGGYKLATRLVRAHNSGARMPFDELEAAFFEAAPPAEGSYDPRDKWTSALEDVGDAGLPELERDPRSTAAQDFTAVPGQGAEGAPSTWKPVDLTAILSGDYVAPRPTLLTRDDGVSLLYPGLTHSVHGESESGKSMVLQYEAVCRLQAGEGVLYIDFESDAASVVQRLQELGATPDQIREGFVYVRPESDPADWQGDQAAFEATLTGRAYALAVIDGVSEAMSVVVGSGHDYNEAAVEYNRKLPRRVAEATGAAVVQIDHVTKSREGRGRFAVGGQHKMASLTGAAYAVDVVSPLGRGLTGELTLSVAKDRPGYVRGHSGPKGADRMQVAARVLVESSAEGIRMTVRAPGTQEPGQGDSMLVELMGRIAGVLAELPEDHKGLSGNAVSSAVTGNTDLKRQALAALVQQGYASRKPIGQGFYHRLTKPFIPEFDTLD